MQRRHWLLYLVMFSLIAINYGDRVALSMGAKDISAEFHLSPIQLGYLLSSFSWTYLIFLLPWGFLTDRIGPRAVMVLGLTTWSAATMVTGLARGIGALFAARMTMGAAEASSFPACGRLVRGWLPPDQYGFASMAVIVGTHAGPAIGAVAFAWLATQFGWRGGFLVLGALGFVWVLFAAAFLRRPADADVAGQGAPAGLDEPPAAGLRALLGSPSLWALFFTQGANVYANYLNLSWLPNYLQTTKSLSMMNTGLLISVPFSVSVVASLCVALISDRVVGRGRQQMGRRKWFVAGMMVLASSIALLPFIDNIAAIVAMLVLVLTATSSATGLNSALLTDLLASPSDAGKAQGFFVLGGNVFGALAPIVTGYVKAETGRFDAAWWLCGAVLLVGACIVVLGVRRPIGVLPRPAGVPAESHSLGRI